MDGRELLWELRGIETYPVKWDTEPRRVSASSLGSMFNSPSSAETFPDFSFRASDTNTLLNFAPVQWTSSTHQVGVSEVKTCRVRRRWGVGFLCCMLLCCMLWIKMMVWINMNTASVRVFVTKSWFLWEVVDAHQTHFHANNRENMSCFVTNPHVSVCLLSSQHTMDPARQKRKEEISKSLAFIQWDLFFIIIIWGRIESETSSGLEWLISLIYKLPLLLFVLCSRSSLAYPDPEGYQVQAVITNTVLCLSPVSCPFTLHCLWSPVTGS